MLINDYQWLVGLIVGFFLNQITISLNRLRNEKDRKKSFKKHILFIKFKLDYISKELTQIPDRTYISEEAKDDFIQSIIDIREYLLNVPKHDIPEKLIDSVADLTADYIFFINSLRSTKIGKKIFDFGKEDDDRRVFLRKVSKRQRESVEKMFDDLDIK